MSLDRKNKFYNNLIFIAGSSDMFQIICGRWLIISQFLDVNYFPRASFEHLKEMFHMRKCISIFTVIKFKGKNNIEMDFSVFSENCQSDDITNFLR